MTKMDKRVRKTVIALLQQFLDTNPNRRIIIAKIIDNYATQMLDIYGAELKCQTKECLEGFLDFHHWGDKIIKPSFKLKDIKGIIEGLSEKKQPPA